jgi:hypothetical protein
MLVFSSPIYSLMHCIPLYLRFNIYANILLGAIFSSKATWKDKKGCKPNIASPTTFALRISNFESENLHYKGGILVALQEYSP